jgi:transcriptional regulator with XRE-family HTH domain
MTYAEKIKLIRKAEGLTQVKFYEMVGLSISTARKFEAGFSEVGLVSLEKIVKHPRFMKYTLWLMTNTTAPESGQISPELETERKSGTA